MYIYICKYLYITLLIHFIHIHFTLRIVALLYNDKYRFVQNMKYILN